ncbi:IS66 family insertion sequence element accessory protein TnpA [Vibrio vulnificus]|uniref:IS66 family insertion sequence element accessory protein TnpA n=1 Tax=Vibrio vulnificus TaxID=672 RepID=UPI001A1AAE2C|nr:IS66 family insertion sequence element accessory protein TnpB [Vibrio vulnificus]MBY7714024.1 IS66 family insertion sequence element accessory protein TnpB [Vibrio vulnificus]MBY7722437.1 IS66 family insertion sequence element accessory protein TnpB [Vibrio vulnificus]HAS6147633.1 IS66 family insertion sequence element accessory protein TnpB [Vibrio vulnificus]
MAKRRSNQEWQALLEQYEISNITQRVFCEQHGLSLSTFFAKRRQLQTAIRPTPVGFVRVEVVEKTTKYQAQIATANMTLLVNDVELSIPQCTPAAYLAELIGSNRSPTGY